MSKNLLGVDFGTTSLKACLFNEKGERLCSESAHYKLITKGEFIEFPADEFFNVFLEVYNKIAKNYKIDALSIDTQGETIIALDKEGKPLYNAIIWLDNRASKEARLIEEKFGEKWVYERTGQAEIPAGYPAPKILWLKENLPNVYNNAKHYCLLEDYIIYRLTGKFVASRSLYSSSLLMDITSGEYIDEMLEFLGVEKAQLSTLKESGEIVGEYNGAKVVASALDQISGITGAGVNKKGIMSETTGTALAVCALTDKIPAYYKGLTVSVYYVKKGLYCLLMWSPVAGAMLEWFKKTFCFDIGFDKMNELAEKVPEGSEGLICVPHLCGTVMPQNNPDAKGGFLGLEMKHERGHFIRAIMESIAYNIKEFVDYMNIPVDEIRSMGGGANSKLWCEIKSAVLGKKIVTLKENETACLGSAIFAGIGVGIFNDVIDAADKIISLNKTYISQSDYGELYKDYKMREKRANGKE